MWLSALPDWRGIRSCRDPRAAGRHRRWRSSAVERAAGKRCKGSGRMKRYPASHVDHCGTTPTGSRSPAMSPNLRASVRAIILDEDDQVLLCRFVVPHPAVPNGAPAVWAAPGGGIEPGEDELSALRRELR